MKKKVALLFSGLIILIFAFLFYFYKKDLQNSSVITLFGNVDVRLVDISFRVPGRVEKMYFDEGQFVPKGTLMAQIEQQPYLDEFEKAKAQLSAATAAASYAAEVFKRREELVGDGAVSEEDYQNAMTQKEVSQDDLKSALATLRIEEKNYNDTSIYAPNDGIVLTRVREEGSVVKQSDPVYTLSLTSPIWVRAFIQEPFLGDIYLDMEADVYTDSSNLPVYKGHIGFISPVAEFTPKTVETLDLRTDLVYRLRIIVDNPDYGLKQGMPVTVKLYKRGSKNHGSSRDSYRELK